MPSNPTLPEDVRAELIRVISRAGVLHGTGTSMAMAVSALPEVFADAVLDSVAPLIIEWATERAAQIAEKYWPANPFWAHEVAAAIRAQFTPETGGE